MRGLVFLRPRAPDNRFLHGCRLLVLSALTLGCIEPAWGVQGSDLLADAVQQGDARQIRTLFHRGAEVNDPQPDGMTALHWACYRGDAPTVRQLISRKANLGATNHFGITPLTLACQRGHGTVVELLLSHGANPETTAPGGETVLMTAARTGQLAPVRALLNRGANPNAQDRSGQTALMWAAAEGNTEVVDALIQKGADIQRRVDSGFNAWFFAAREGRSEVIRRLLKAGMDVNSAMDPRRSVNKGPSKGTSALILAIENGHYELALELINAGADPNDQRSGYAPLHVMTWVRKPPRGEDYGAPPPAELGHLDSLGFIRALVKRGANVNTTLTAGKGAHGKFNPKGATAFFMASATSDLPYMKLLLELGADPLMTNVDGCTALIAACGIHVGSDQATEAAGEEPEVLEAARLLLKLGVPINAVDANGETAMHAAALKNLPKVVQFLADNGADPSIWNTKNAFGSTPLMIAQGYRPGNFKPSAETVEAIARVMLAAGLPLPANTPPPQLRNSDWEPVPVRKKP